MLNAFPDLLVLSFFAPTLIRIAVALALFGVAYRLLRRRAELSRTPLPILGNIPGWVFVSAAVHGLVGLALFFGYSTQIAALAGMLVLGKGAVLAPHYPRALPLKRLEYVLLAVMCLSLLLTGAGALAFDIRL